ncbi:MAG TPA: toll/interleukin-1 receptor domain-containing protein [Candidatus Acidoferrales bacterium]|jgi:tetratricopeptide (TPR) repeat protein|nr:toll/interleukin-1 receptor domain-containing protein [Candidatus Acidoferrales bacterium]
MKHFFISRAGEDAEFAKWVADTLEEAGYTTILQDFDILPGHSFPEKMNEALARTEQVIALLSPHYVAKEWTRKELWATLSTDAEGRKRRLIPVRIAVCELPPLIRDLVYIDLPGRDREKLLNGIRPESRREPDPLRTFTSKLPTVDPTLLGRDKELAFLDRAWADPAANLVQIIAAGGTGKTALVDKWFRRHLGEATIFGWSFYSQGTSENRQTSSDPFFADILRFFKITIEPTASVYAKAEALADHLRNTRVLLILDGCEPLQDAGGDMKDGALKAGLQELATQNKGLVVCTTRVRIHDVPDDAPRARSIDLDNLDQEHGAAYLRHLGVDGTDEELRQASADYANHALALTLLGTYLVDFCDKDVRRRIEIPKLMVDELKAGARARHVMEGYARQFAGKPELEMLRALGYFDRPAEPAALKLVLPPMPDLTCKAALKRLRAARLILSADAKAHLDCHPLIREHFAATATAEGHARLYEHYRKQAPDRPDTLEAMTPLFYAVRHGCQAGRHQKVLDEVFSERILRGNEAYLTRKLGAYGTTLSLLANFFQSPWTTAIPALSPADQSWVIIQSAFALRALGRLADAVEPMLVGVEGEVEREDWPNAATSYGNLSELRLALGDVDEAIVAADRALDIANRSGDWNKRVRALARFADALHQSGSLAAAARLFERAEHMQSEEEPRLPTLYSHQGNCYCDLLLHQGQTTEVVRRAAQTLRWAEQYRGLGLLDIGFDHLSLGRAHPPGSVESATHLNQAVDYLRRAGAQDFLPLALLARGTQNDLDEVFRIATRSGMRLHLTDYHLAMARLHHSREHFDKAEALIAETGYHRRDAELEELRQSL